MSAGGVLRKRAPLSKDAAKSAVWLALARLTYTHGAGTVADHAGCSARTIAEAKAEHSLPELHSIINLLGLDATVLDELMAMVGFRMMLIRVGQSDGQYFEMMANAAELASTLADALRDRRVDHLEEAKIEGVLRAILPALNAWVAGRDVNKVVAA